MIRLENLGKGFPEKNGVLSHWIFRNVQLHIPKNGSAAIVGLSGSGKSVLLKTIAGLLDPTEGKVGVNSPRLGMLFQKNALFTSLSVRENLLFPLRETAKITGHEADRLAEKFLGDVGLSGTDSLFPDELSGGMQKRLGIARCLILDPEVVLFDDPTAGLDPITSQKIAELIRGLQTHTQMTFIAVTNDMQRAYQLGDQVYLLANGKLLGGESPAKTRETRDPAIRQFIFGQTEGPLT